MLLRNLITAVLREISVTLIGTNNANDTTTIALPSGVLPGDIAVLFDNYTNTSQSPMSTPSGWTPLLIEQTLIGGSGSSTHGQTISYKVLTTETAGTSISGISSGVGAVTKAIYVFRPQKAINKIEIVSKLIQSTIPPVLPSAVISGARIHFAIIRVNTGLSVTAGMNPAADTTVIVNSAAISYLKNRTSAGEQTTASISAITGSPTYAVLTTFGLKVT